MTAEAQRHLGMPAPELGQARNQPASEEGGHAGQRDHAGVAVAGAGFVGGRFDGAQAAGDLLPVDPALRGELNAAPVLAQQGHAEDSSAAICLLTALTDRHSTLAAWVRLPCRATASKASNSFKEGH